MRLHCKANCMVDGFLHSIYPHSRNFVIKSHSYYEECTFAEPEEVLNISDCLFATPSVSCFARCLKIICRISKRAHLLSFQSTVRSSTQA